ncbi:hypothetical protein V6N13_086215 [Hibiscus sabdariffa]
MSFGNGGRRWRQQLVDSDVSSAHDSDNNDGRGGEIVLRLLRKVASACWMRAIDRRCMHRTRNDLFNQKPIIRVKRIVLSNKMSHLIGCSGDKPKGTTPQKLRPFFHGYEH